MVRRIAQYMAYIPVLILLALLLLFPEDAAVGARSGLSVCAGVIIPSLFPFLVASSLFSSMGLHTTLAHILGPLFQRLSLPPIAAAPLLLGLCGGYPVGARAVSELVRSGSLHPKEAERLLPWCNNTGPGFIIGVAGSAVFGSVRIGVLLYLCHILAAFALALLIGRSDAAAQMPAHPVARPAGPDILPRCISTAVSVIPDICGCIVFFSMLTELLRAGGVFSSLAAAISARTGLEMRWALSLLSGVLELGCGITSLRGMSPGPQSLALAAFLLGFGGLSVHAQTFSALADTKIKCARHFAGRIAHGLLSAVLILLYCFVRPLQI